MRSIFEKANRLPKIVFPALLLSIFIGFSSQVVASPLPCGDIITPEETVGIEDCVNPFGELTLELTPFTLKINGETVVADTELLISAEGTADYVMSGTLGSPSDPSHSLFLHDGNNYRQVFFSNSSPTEEDYRSIAAAFFAEGIDIEPYIQQVLSGGADTEAESWDWDLYYNFGDHVSNVYKIPKPALLPGTYTLVSTQALTLLNQNLPDEPTSILAKIKSAIIPTAHAQFDSGPIFTLTFTLVAQPELTGASNILFIPGIMGTRLYEAENTCHDEYSGEVEIWFSVIDCRHERLKTNFLGNSIFDIFTKPKESSIVDETLSFNLYKTFLGELEDWKDEEKISDYKAITYDWRLSLENILRSKLEDGKIVYDSSIKYNESYLYQSLKNLIETSNSGKVTIVTHSNGGLLAKYLLIKLEIEDDPLLSKIDNLIMVGVPQVGTPESIVGILHGSGIGPLSLVMSQPTSRYLLGNMAFAHHLLPHADYFASVSTPVISFEAGSVTDAWINQFGETINTEEELKDFMSKDSGRAVPEREDLATPAVVDGHLFSYKNFVASNLYSFDPPETMDVYQIAGTGLLTPSSIEYFTDRECIKRNIFTLFRCSEYETKLGYRVAHTIDGDETVVVPSALSISEELGGERWWLNLLAYNNNDLNPFFSKKHKDIIEIEDIIKFIKNINFDSNYKYTYLTNSQPDLKDGERLVFQLHSPLDLSLVDSEGNRVSSSTVEIKGATYRRYGELQYISIPSKVILPTIILTGVGFGSFTLDIEKWLGETRLETATFSGIPSDVNTIVLLPVVDDFKKFELQIDYDGDGEFEGEYQVNGSFISNEIETGVPSSTDSVDLRSNSSQTRVMDRVQVPNGIVAGISTNSILNNIEQERLMQMVLLLTELVRLLTLLNNK